MRLSSEDSNQKWTTDFTPYSFTANLTLNSKFNNDMALFYYNSTIGNALAPKTVIPDATDLTKALLRPLYLAGPP